MKRFCVTGAAGFIGSHLCEALLAQGHEVVGVDAFIPYYPRDLKERNLDAFRAHPAFAFHELDLRAADLAPVVDGCHAIVHEAAMAGLMKSWSDFDLYVSCNMIATQRVLEAARKARTPHVVHISTSSVYGREATGPEDLPLRPFSPYGVTKVGTENLCHAFTANFGLPITILRYFSVYGPRQRPDMAYNILIRNLLTQTTFPLFGDGEQTRSNTFIADGVRATLLAVENPEKSIGETFNVGGGEIVSLNRVMALLEELTGQKAILDRRPPRPGDQKNTAADISKIRSVLGYEPSTRVLDGLRAQVEWQRPLIERP